MGLSAPAAADRVHKLEEKGVIKGYTTLVNPEAMGYGLAALIAVILERPEHREAFFKNIHKLPEILECHHIAGEKDKSIKNRALRELI